MSVVLYKRRLASQKYTHECWRVANSERLAPAVSYEMAMATGIYTSTSTCTGTGVAGVRYGH